MYEIVNEKKYKPVVELVSPYKGKVISQAVSCTETCIYMVMIAVPTRCKISSCPG